MQHTRSGAEIDPDRSFGSVSSSRPSTAQRPTTNLPLQLTTFIGRDTELAATRRLLAHTRLLTLTGPSGSGKTRLALELADTVLADYPAGVWLVELATLFVPALIPQTIAAALGLREPGDQSLTSHLSDYLQSKTLLLVLDNCEHLRWACAELAAILLRACPSLRILATSQVALSAPGETVWPVPPLSLPDPTAEATPDTLAQSEAVRLFLDRARAAAPSFTLTDRNAEAVAAICRRLDGIPLAIELAAARIRVLPPDQLIDRLHDRFRVLTRGSQATLSRHQTLRAAVDWSYDLLDDAERALLRRLAVFAGGFTLEAAEAVASDTDLPADFILDLLANLVDRSLVVPPRGDSARYHLLETIRHYAAEKLHATGEADATAGARHSAFYLALAERAQTHTRGPDQGVWLDALEGDHDNLRAALTRSIDTTDSASAYRLAWSLAPLWWRRSYLTEGRRWLESILALSTPPGGEALRARALCVAGALAIFQGDYAGGSEALEASAALARISGDRQTEGYALTFLGQNAYYHGDIPSALRLLEQSAALAEAEGDDWGLALALNWQGNTVMAAGDQARSRTLFERVLNMQPAVRDSFILIQPLTGLGELARLAGNPSAATTYYTESLAMARALGYSEAIGVLLSNLAHARRDLADYPVAIALYHEALAVAQRLGHKRLIADILLGLAIISANTGHSERAARLLAAAEALRDAITAAVEVVERHAHDQTVAHIRATLPPDQLTALWAAGRALTLHDAVALALEPLPTPTPPAATPPPTTLAPSPSTVPPPAPAELRLLVLGPARVYRANRLLTAADWTYLRARELLFLLLSHPSRSREQMGLVFWPDASTTQVRNNLNTLLYHLRRALGRSDWVLFHDDRYHFNRDLGYTYDVEDFERHLTAARQAEAAHQPDAAIGHLTAAVDLYHGDFLDDLTDGDWYLLRREELRRLFLDALLRLGQLHLAAARPTDAIVSFRRAVAHDPYLEAAHRDLMRALARQGERGQALRHYQALVDLLAAELGAPPAPETRALFDSIQRGDPV